MHSGQGKGASHLHPALLLIWVASCPCCCCVSAGGCVRLWLLAGAQPQTFEHEQNVQDSRSTAHHSTAQRRVSTQHTDARVSKVISQRRLCSARLQHKHRLYSIAQPHSPSTAPTAHVHCCPTPHARCTHVSTSQQPHLPRRTAWRGGRSGPPACTPTHLPAPASHSQSRCGQAGT